MQEKSIKKFTQRLSFFNNPSFVNKLMQFLVRLSMNSKPNQMSNKLVLTLLSSLMGLVNGDSTNDPFKNQFNVSSTTTPKADASNSNDKSDIILILTIVFITVGCICLFCLCSSDCSCNSNNRQVPADPSPQKKEDPESVRLLRRVTEDNIKVIVDKEEKGEAFEMPTSKRLHYGS